MIRNGTIAIDRKTKAWTLPHHENFSYVQVMASNKGYDVLSPYTITDEKGNLHENVWQFGKVYATVPAVNNPKSGWQHGEETHAVLMPEDCTPDPASGIFQAEDGRIWKLTDAWRAWHRKGIAHPKALRYPVGFGHRHSCLFSVIYHPETDTFDNDGPLNYIESRKRVYGPIYIDQVKKAPKFHELVERLRGGENLLIAEVDGPKGEWGDPCNGTGGNITRTILYDADVYKKLLNDPQYPFGHGYCLTIALLEVLHNNPNIFDSLCQ